MSFTALTNSGGSLIIDRPPIIIDRYNDRGKRSAVASSVSGTRIITEYDAAAIDSRFILKFSLLTIAQAETLADIRDSGGTVTVRLIDGGGTFSAVFAPKDTHKSEAIIGPHPDSNRAGGAIDSGLTWYRCEITMYRV